MLLTIAALAVVLGVLIFVHELGHFLAAKAVGIQVLRFSLGFGRPVLALRRGETEYCLSALPLGGYVRMATLEEEGAGEALEGGKLGTPIDPERVFEKKSVAARAFVLTAGVAMNALLAFLVYTGMAAVLGSPELGTTQVDSVATAKLPRGAEALAQLGFGDRIVRVNGDTVRSWNAIEEPILTGPAELVFEVAGRPDPLVVRLADPGRQSRERLAEALTALIPPRLGIIEPGGRAIRAGLKPGDLVIRANDDTVRSWSDVLRAVWHSPGRPLRLEVLRRGGVVDVTVVPDVRIDTDTTSPRPHVYGAIGAGSDPPTVHVRESFGVAVVRGAVRTAAGARLILGFLKGLFAGQVSISQVGGPILVGQYSGQVARLGLDWFLNFLALFSVNLAILNILPIPLLDGGHLTYLAAEAVRGRPLSVAVRHRLNQVGMAVLLALMALVLTNDVLRILPR